jgi:hypothetical protein
MGGECSTNEYWCESQRGKRPLGRPKCRWVENIKMDLEEAGWFRADWIGLAQDRDQGCAVVNAVMNILVPYNAGEFLSGCAKRWPL